MVYQLIHGLDGTMVLELKYEVISERLKVEKTTHLCKVDSRIY